MCRVSPAPILNKRKNPSGRLPGWLLCQRPCTGLSSQPCAPHALPHPCSEAHPPPASSSRQPRVTGSPRGASLCRATSSSRGLRGSWLSCPISVGWQHGGGGLAWLCGGRAHSRGLLGGAAGWALPASPMSPLGGGRGSKGQPVRESRGTGWGVQGTAASDPCTPPHLKQDLGAQTPHPAMCADGALS